MTSTPESAPEPRWVCALGNPFCSAVTAKPRLNGDNRHAECWRNNTRPAASSPDEGGEWVCVAGSPLTCNETSQHDAPGHERCGPASADEGAPEGCEIDPVSSRGCERGTPGCVTQHADEGTRQRPDTDTLRKIGAGTDGDGIRLLTRAERAFLARAADWIDAQPDAAPPAPSTPAPQAEGPRIWVDAEGDLIVGDSAGPTIGLRQRRTMVVYRDYRLTDEEAIAALTRPATSPSTPAEPGGEA